MACRIGMATNVSARVQQLKESGVVPWSARHQIIRSGLTYEDANRIEVAKRNACGPHCRGQAGGGYVSGPVWSVYRIDW